MGHFLTKENGITMTEISESIHYELHFKLACISSFFIVCNSYTYLENLECNAQSGLTTILIGYGPTEILTIDKGIPEIGFRPVLITPSVPSNVL